MFGTLKRGFPLHERGLAGARCLGRYRTVERFPMLVAGPRFAPMMLNEPGRGRQVTGELDDVDAARLAVLDALESIGVPGNFRRRIAVEPIAGGNATLAHVYMKAPPLAVPAHTGWLDDYQDRRFLGSAADLPQSARRRPASSAIQSEFEPAAARRR